MQNIPMSSLTNESHDSYCKNKEELNQTKSNFSLIFDSTLRSNSSEKLAQRAVFQPAAANALETASTSKLAAADTEDKQPDRAMSSADSKDIILSDYMAAGSGKPYTRTDNPFTRWAAWREDHIAASKIENEVKDEQPQANKDIVLSDSMAAGSGKPYTRADNPFTRWAAWREDFYRNDQQDNVLRRV